MKFHGCVKFLSLFPLRSETKRREPPRVSAQLQPLKAGGQLGGVGGGARRGHLEGPPHTDIPQRAGGLQRSRAARTLSWRLGPSAISVSLQLTVCIVLRGAGRGGLRAGGTRPHWPPQRDVAATGPNPAQHVLQRHSEWVLFTVIQVSHNPAGGEPSRGQHSSGGLEGSWRGISEPGQS